MTDRPGFGLTAAATGLLLVLSASAVLSFPVNGNQTVLPNGTELNEDAIEQPREIFKSEATGGHRSYLINLGDMAFNSPSLFGGVAKRAGMSCGTCHMNGASNPKLFVPGLSTRPGNFDTTGPFFNPKAHNGVTDPVTTPSLRGARYLAPYGHDGRNASLRDFVRNVIVGEFAGSEPSPDILDGLIAYIQDIDFLPNSRLRPDGTLTEQASVAEQRGQALFQKPFASNPSLSCAGCHQPSSTFTDHLRHDVGSDGLFKTPTLANANFNGPYFHDGRYDSYDQVVDHFDHIYNLRLKSQDKRDLVAYLSAVGDGEQPYRAETVDVQLTELEHFVSVLDTAIPAHDGAIVTLTVDTVGGELRDLTEKFPDRKDTTVSAGKEERMKARAGLKELVLALRRIDIAALAGQFDEAQAGLVDYRNALAEVVPLLKAAEPYSLFNPAIHDAHYAAMRQLIQTAGKSALNAH